MSTTELDRMVALALDGQLDRVESLALDARLAGDPELAARYAAAYDARVASLGFMAFVGPDPAVAECLSPATLERYVRRALDDEAQAIVQAHLACPLCRAQVEETQRAAAQVVPISTQATKATQRRTWRWVGAAAAVAASFAALMIWRPADHSGALRALVEARGRRFEVRLSAPDLDAFRRYDPELSAGAPTSALPHGLLADLATRGDHRRLAAVYLLAGDPARASSALAQAGETPDVDSDRAAAAIAGGEPIEALAFTERALDVAPAHQQALWNRALALRAVGLPLTAAEAFDRSAAGAGPGWADEARHRADRLRRPVLEQRDAWKRARAAGMALRIDQTPVDRALVVRFEGLMRLFFYDALRTAESAAQVLALAPMAEALDTRFGGQRLSELVRTIAGSDFETRAPLAATYRGLLTGDVELDHQQLGALLEALDSAGAQDILLGVRWIRRRLIDDPGAYAAVAQSSGDGWFVALSHYMAATAAAADGRPLAAEGEYLAALASSEVVYRRLHVRTALAYLYLDVNRLPEAREHTLVGLEAARRSEEWGHENALIQLRGRIALYDNQFALARAALTEAMVREPEFCQIHQFATRHIAMSYVFDKRPERAKAAMHALGACKGPLLPLGAGALVDAYRMSGATTEEQTALEGELRRIATDDTDEGHQALGEYLLGRFLVERDPIEGRAWLERTIAHADRLPTHNGEAQEARTRAYSTLIVAAARDGDYDRVLELLGAEAQADASGACVLGAVLDDERRVVALRTSAGVVGLLDASWAGTIAAQPVGDVVPTALKARLSTCRSVAVLALPPLVGRPELLPPEIAWSYRVGGAANTGGPAASPHRLVVANVALPQRMRLPPLPYYEPRAEGDAPTTILEGRKATLANVLQSLASATEVEFYTHGWHDAWVSDSAMLVLSEDREGRAALTARDLRSVKLAGQPVVVLGACRAARTSILTSEPWSLPRAFVRAGARVVIASPEPMPAVEAQAFSKAVRAALRRGDPPRVAVRDARRRWIEKDPKTWAADVLVFER